MPVSNMWMLARTFATLLAVLGLLWGCGSGSKSEATVTRHAPAHRALSAPDAQSRNMVSAVGDPKGAAVPLQVKFQLRSRPKPSEPVEVDIQITPVSGSVDRVSGTMQGEDGLELVEGDKIAPQERPAEGVPITHTVKVLPKRDGIFTLSAQLAVDSAGQTIKETFSIPVIAGAGLPDLYKPAATSGGAAPAGPPGKAVPLPKPTTTAAAQ
jgi:hypothetical protein